MVQVPYTVSTTPVRVAQYDPTRKKLSIFNDDSSKQVFWAKADPNVSSSSGPHQGKRLAPQDWYMNQSEDCIRELWCVVASGSVTVIVEED